MKKNHKIIIFTLLGFITIAALANNQLISTAADARPHGNQYDMPELTRNNYLMGFLNENRSSYKISFYDINIDFNIEEKSIDGFVTIKARSIRDLNKLQIDLAKNLNVEKITYNTNIYGKT